MFCHEGSGSTRTAESLCSMDRRNAVYSQCDRLQPSCMSPGYSRLPLELFYGGLTPKDHPVALEECQISLVECFRVDRQEQSPFRHPGSLLERIQGSQHLLEVVVGDAVFDTLDDDYAVRIGLHEANNRVREDCETGGCDSSFPRRLCEPDDRSHLEIVPISDAIGDLSGNDQSAGNEELQGAGRGPPPSGNLS